MAWITSMFGLHTLFITLGYTLFTLVAFWQTTQPAAANTDKLISIQCLPIDVLV